jgi:hypothetical protein
MQFISEWKIREAWRIVATGHEQWEQTGLIEPKHLATVRTVQIDMAQHLARFEDGPAILFTAMSKRRQLRHIEQAASDLICLSEQRAVHGQHTNSAVISARDCEPGDLHVLTAD